MREALDVRTSRECWCGLVGSIAVHDLYRVTLAIGQVHVTRQMMRMTIPPGGWVGGDSRAQTAWPGSRPGSQWRYYSWLTSLVKGESDGRWRLEEGPSACREVPCLPRVPFVGPRRHGGLLLRSGEAWQQRYGRGVDECTERTEVHVKVSHPADCWRVVRGRAKRRGQGCLESRLSSFRRLGSIE